MTVNWLRRGALTAMLGLLALLGGCGSGTIYNALTPSRFIVFGDGFADVGQAGAEYTVNDGSTNTWVQQVASLYGQTLVTSSAGGLDYAWGNARVSQTPDAAGISSTPTIAQQISTFLASNTFGPNDVVIIEGGTSDMIVQGQAFANGTISQAAMNANLTQAANDLVTQVQRLVNAGAKHIVLSGVYDMSKSPWGLNAGASTPLTTSILSNASIQFNDTLLIGVSGLGSYVYYADFAYYMNLMANAPGTYGMSNSTNAVCVVTDPGQGIGIGTNQINSFLCTPSNVGNGGNYAAYLFADNVYITPQGARQLGNYVQAQLTNRW